MMDRRHLFEVEALKPKSTGATLRRLWSYFGGRRILVLAVLGLALLSAWLQVLTPDLIGQAVDCYLVPASQNAVEGQRALLDGAAEAGSTNCWYTDADPGRTSDEILTGVGKLVLLLIGLYVAGSFTTGLQFNLIRYAGLHVLADLRMAVFRHIHRLSLGYYSRQEAGDIMSRMTNDTDTLQQALSFALVQVVRGALLVG